MMRISAFLVPIGILLSACIPGGPIDDESGGSNPVPSVPAQTLNSLEAVVADLAARNGVSPNEIEVVVQERVTWPNGAIGCPQPGIGYTQALIDGSRIVLETGTVRYNYHSGRTGIFKLCEGAVEAPVVNPDA